MANWLLTVHLSDYWQNQNRPFEELRDGIVDRINASRWGAVSKTPEKLDRILDRVRRAADVEEFDALFNLVYDLADTDRVWIETHGKVVQL